MQSSETIQEENHVHDWYIQRAYWVADPDGTVCTIAQFQCECGEQGLGYGREFDQ